jgi:hypothetical protein
MDISKPQIRSSRANRSAATKKAANADSLEAEYREFESDFYWVAFNHMIEMLELSTIPLDSVINKLMASILRPNPEQYYHHDLAEADLAILLDRRVLAVIHRGPDGRPVATMIGATAPHK